MNNFDSSQFPKLNTKVTPEFKEILQQLVQERQKGTPHKVTEGEILSEWTPQFKSHLAEVRQHQRPKMARVKRGAA